MDIPRNEEDVRTLEAIFEVDQQAIRDFRAGRINEAGLAQVNKEHVDIIRRIISRAGFPTIDSTSRKAYKAAVLIVLHSDDLELLNQSIQALTNAQPASIEKKDIGYMVDKARLAQNLPQVYGTQYKIGPSGAVEFIEIEDPADLDKRRAELGMGSFSEYRKMAEGYEKGAI